MISVCSRRIPLTSTLGSENVMNVRANGSSWSNTRVTALLPEVVAMVAWNFASAEASVR